MKNKISDNIDMSLLAEHLINNTRQEDWKNVVLKNLKLVNAVNAERLTAKKITKIFREASKQARREIKNQSKSKHKSVYSMSDLLKWKSPKDPWVIECLLPKSGIAILSGDSGNFKTWSTLHYALCITNGSMVYGHFNTNKANVLIIDEEDGVALLQQRLNVLSAEEKMGVHFMIGGEFNVHNEGKVHEVMRLVKKHKIGVIIIDSLVRIHRGDENNAMDMSEVFRVLRTFSNNGVAILINHHHRKNNGENQIGSQAMRGSSDILAALDCHMHIKKRDDCVVISQTKNRISQELKPFRVDVQMENDKMTFAYCGDESKSGSKQDKNKKLILEVIVGNSTKMSRADIDEAVAGRIGVNKVQATLTALTDSGEVKFEKLAQGKKLYWVEDDE